MAKLDQVNYKGTIAEIVPEIAPLFKTTETYAAGDQVIYEADWYTFKEAKEAGAWDATKVDGPFKVANEIVSLKEDLSYITGNTSIPMVASRVVAMVPGGSVTMSDGVPQYSSTSSSYSCGMMECASGDKFTISGHGGATPRLWGFVDASGNVLAVADAETTATDLILTAPNNSAWIIIHTNNSAVSYSGEVVHENLQRLNVITDEMKSLSLCYNINGFIVPTDGSLYADSVTYKSTDYILFDNKSVMSLIDVYTGSSSSAVAFYDSDKNFISAINNIKGNYKVENIPENTAYIRCSSRVTNENPQAYIGNNALINEKIGNAISEANPENSTFFTKFNWFDLASATYYTDRYVDANGVIRSSSNAKSIVFPVDPETSYYFDAPYGNRRIVAEKSNNSFDVGMICTVLYTSGEAHPIHFTTGQTAKYVIVYFNNGEYDWETLKHQIVLNKGAYNGNPDTHYYIDPEYIAPNTDTPLKDAQVLIFGDSITSTCNITIDAQNQTSAYSWKNPSNSYVDGNGNTVDYSMWPKILKLSEPCGEIRNYAQSGASYKTSTREEGFERQNLQYQIDVALNDLDNPNNVFEVDNFVPDIVIFALGTNDGAPNDTYDSAMNKTVLVTGTATIDVDATLANLDETKFCESARKAFLRIKKAFPMAQVFCVLPIQRAGDETNTQNLHTYLKQMAERYGCIIIDGTFSCGIVRELNVASGLGTYLKDGLHPNEKGQNLMARAIITALKAHYLPFTHGFN